MIPTLFWESTKRCNFRCRYCYSASGAAAANECRPDGIIRLLDQFRRQGGRLLIASGGEPTLYPGLETVLAAAKQIGLRVVLCTNGSHHDSAWVSELASLVAEIVVSVDGPEAYTNQLRGSTRAFSHAERLYEACRRQGIPTTVQLNVSDESWQFLPWFRQFVRERGVLSVKLAHISPWGNAEANGIGLSGERQLDLVGVANEWAQETAFRLIPRTNLMLQRVFRSYYADLNAALAPWLLSDGSVVPFYVPDSSQWVVGEAGDPGFRFEALQQHERVSDLLRRAHQMALTLPVVSLPDVVYRVAGEYACNG